MRGALRGKVRSGDEHPQVAGEVTVRVRLRKRAASPGVHAARAFHPGRVSALVARRNRAVSAATRFMRARGGKAALASSSRGLMIHSGCPRSKVFSLQYPVFSPAWRAGRAKAGVPEHENRTLNTSLEYPASAAIQAASSSNSASSEDRFHFLLPHRRRFYPLRAQQGHRARGAREAPPDCAAYC